MLGSNVVILAVSCESSSRDTADPRREPMSTAREFRRLTMDSLRVLPLMDDISVSLAIRLNVLVRSRTLMDSFSLVRLSTLTEPPRRFSLLSSMVRLP